MVKKNKCVVIGATGFVGSHLCDDLESRGFRVQRITRIKNKIDSAEGVIYCDFSKIEQIKKILKGVDVVFHLAAKTHSSNLKNRSDFFDTNFHLTKIIVKASIGAGVKKFIFLSSIKVNGEQTYKNEEFSERSVTAPQDYYGKSKLEAEKYLTLNYVKSKISVVIIRSPIVYGFPLKANFRLLVKLVSLRFPLPFLCVKNLRDFIYVRNLTDALILCSEHPRASGKVYLVSDGQPISTPVLIRKISNLIQVRAFLFPFPVFLIKFLAYFFFHSNKCNKLINSLRINSSTIKRDLKWNPPYTLDQGLKETLDRFNYL